MYPPKLFIRENLWVDLITELLHRGQNVRESGAFLLGKNDNNIITSFICYDDLDPDCLNEGYINFNGNGYIPLWEICLKEELKVLGDIHTHPGKWTGQSKYDQDNPMISQPGHIALIAPQFATVRNQKIKGLGIHEYLGDHKWNSWETKSNVFKII
jgi:proteasome lid subunit RPN8/RPN11